MFAASSAVAQPPAAESRGKPFWLALAKDCMVPAGDSAFGLVSEAVSFLGSPDTEWRDDVAWSKMTAPGTPVFTHAEDERLAASLVSVVRRPDFDAAPLDPWLARFVALEKRCRGARGIRRRWR